MEGVVKAVPVGKVTESIPVEDLNSADTGLPSCAGNKRDQTQEESKAKKRSTKAGEFTKPCTVANNNSETKKARKKAPPPP